MKRSFDALRAHTRQPNHSADSSAPSAAAAAKAPSRTSNSLLAKLGRLGSEASTNEWRRRLRRRHRHQAHEAQPQQQSPPSPQPPPSTDLGHLAAVDDIESGVEITEEMSHQQLLQHHQQHHHDQQLQQQRRPSPAKRATTLTGRQNSADDIFVDVRDDDDDDDNTGDKVRHRSAAGAAPAKAAPTVGPRRAVADAVRTVGAVLAELLAALPRRRTLVAYAAVLLGAWLLAVPAFVCGMLACWCAMGAAQALAEAGRTVATRWMQRRWGGAADDDDDGE